MAKRKRAVCAPVALDDGLRPSTRPASAGTRSRTDRPAGCRTGSHDAGRLEARGGGRRACRDIRAMKSVRQGYSCGMKLRSFVRKKNASIFPSIGPVGNVVALLVQTAEPPVADGLAGTQRDAEGMFVRNGHGGYRNAVDRDRRRRRCIPGSRRSCPTRRRRDPCRRPYGSTRRARAPRRRSRRPDGASRPAAP